MNNHASSSLACSILEKEEMVTGVYVKELTIRCIYVWIGRRITYVQRKTYENRISDGLEEVDQINGVMVREEDERLLKGISERSRNFTRISTWGRRRITRIVYRTVSPGRFRHEIRKIASILCIVSGGRTRGIWKWYESEVDLTRSDRRRSRCIFICRVYGRYRYVNPVYKGFRRELRALIIWCGRIVWMLRVDDRRDLSTRRSMRRSICVYIVCIERWIMRRYRRKGRKMNKNI